MDEQMKIMEKTVKEATDILTYCIEHVSDFNIADQIRLCSAILKIGDELKPLYLRNASKDDTEKFIIKL